MEDLTSDIQAITQWLREQTEAAGAKGLIVGVSGGLDSAVVAGLIKKAYPQDSLGLLLPCHSDPKDVEDGQLVCKALDLAYHQLDLSGAHDALFKPALDLLAGQEIRQMAADANLRARLRMCALYTIANALNYLVVGTDNAAEYYTGYFTKYGDGGCDLLPIAAYTKGEVVQMAHHLGIPPQVIEKAPSAGLWPGQTDEEELGLTYAQLDAYLENREVGAAARQRIERLHLNSQHKRRPPAIYPRPEGPVHF